MIARIEVGERRVDVIELHTILSILSPDPAKEVLSIFEALEALVSKRPLP